MRFSSIHRNVRPSTRILINHVQKPSHDRIIKMAQLNSRARTNSNSKSTNTRSKKMLYNKVAILICNSRYDFSSLSIGISKGNMMVGRITIPVNISNWGINSVITRAAKQLYWLGLNVNLSPLEILIDKKVSWYTNTCRKYTDGWRQELTHLLYLLRLVRFHLSLAYYCVG